MKKPKSPFSFSKGNAKLGKETLTFSLPTGHTCPFAKDCLAKVNQITGKLTDGKHQKFRCFSASTEAAFTSVRKSRWKNMEAVKHYLSKNKLSEALIENIPEGTKEIRIHVGGDFFSQAYFDAWMQVAQTLPQILFYAYTKSIPYWKKRFDKIPDNFRLTASLGGSHDKLALALNLPTSTVIDHPDQAVKKGLEIDHNDSHPKQALRINFALLLHGMQPKGSPAALKIKALKDADIKFSYHRRKNKLANSEVTHQS